MIRIFNYFWRHPRRTGFAIFNLLVIAAIAAIAVGVTYVADLEHNGVAALPNLVLGYTALALLAAMWFGGWLAWAGMVAARHTHPEPKLMPARSAVQDHEAASSRTAPEP